MWYDILADASSPHLIAGSEGQVPGDHSGSPALSPTRYYLTPDPAARHQGEICPELAAFSFSADEPLTAQVGWAWLLLDWGWRP